MNLVIINYNAGNVQSVLFALERLGVKATLTDDLEAIAAADKVIFPGVGEASSAMKYLIEKKLDKTINGLENAMIQSIKKQAEKTEQRKDANPQTNTKSKGASNWYFYNETAVSAGRLAFAKEWSGRPLEDNWRRSNKGFSNVTDLLGADDTEENEKYEGKAADNVKKMLYASIKTLGDRMKEVPKDELQVKETKDLYLYISF